jgi:hypothetical protein
VEEYFGSQVDSPELDELARRCMAMATSVDKPSIGHCPVESDLVHTITVWTTRTCSGALGAWRWRSHRPAQDTMYNPITTRISTGYVHLLAVSSADSSMVLTHEDTRRLVVLGGQTPVECRTRQHEPRFGSRCAGGRSVTAGSHSQPACIPGTRTET